MDRFVADVALHRPTLSNHISSSHQIGKGGARARMNVAAHQEKKENEKTGKREAGEERKQPTDLKEALSCLFAVVQRSARRKDDLYEQSAQGN